MWGVDPRLLCQKHLLGEHVEMHMFVGAILKGTSIRGYRETGLVDVRKIRDRHDELATEMVRRGMTHRSDLRSFPYPSDGLPGHIDIQGNLRELAWRCGACRDIQEGAKIPS